jgi:uncharacterized OsmC-like protein
VHAHLGLAAGVSEELAQRALEKAERGCLVSNSLKAPVHLETYLEMLAAPQVA